jgi:predicted SnoaL-like aldol condensation-catalyzing enzyme
MTRKDIANDFLTRCARGDSRTAFSKYAGADFKHHNAWFKGDAGTLMKAMEESHQQNPNKVFEIRRIIHDNDIVATHSFIRQSDNDRGMAVVHILRFDGNDKIVEFWDLAQPLPEKEVNENGMF